MLRPVLPVAIFAVTFWAVTNAADPAAPAQPVATTQPHTYTVTPNTNAILLMPELKAAPPPAWIKPGYRLSYYAIDGSTAGAGMALVPTMGGKFADKDGKTYTFQQVCGAAGHGITQADIVSVQPDAVAVDLKISVINDVTGPLTVATQSGSVTTPGAAMDGWIHPDVLKKYSDLNGQGVTSTKTKYEAAGKTWNALWQSVTGDGTASGKVYDTETGLLLHRSLSSTSKTHTITINPSGERVDTGGTISMSQLTLVAIRQLKLPWTQGKLPKSLDGVKALRYDGVRLGWIPNGDQLPPSPIRSICKITGRGPDFVQIHNNTVIVVATVPSPSESDQVCGPGQLTPLAVDPADLAKLKAGQELDRDPITKAVTVVSYVGKNKAGRDVVVITEAAPGQGQQRGDYTYDAASGFMIGTSLTNPVLSQVTQIALTGKE